MLILVEMMALMEQVEVTPITINNAPNAIKFGHTIDQCYSKHGYPPGFKPRENYVINHLATSEDEQNQNARVFYVPHNSHHGSTSQPLQLAPNQLQQLITALQQTTTKPTHSIGQIHSTSFGESTSQQQPSNSGNHNTNLSTWILDSGASDHVTNDFSRLLTFHFIKLISVNLPNGIIVSAKYCGCI